MRRLAIALAYRRSQGKGTVLYVRTASGSFLNAANIVQLSPQRGGDNEITGWVAICRDGNAFALAAYYATPGQIEKVLANMAAAEGS